MKSHSRSVAVVVLAFVLSIQLAPIAGAMPRDPGDIRTRIERLIQKFQRFIGLVPFDNGPVPPHP